MMKRAMAALVVVGGCAGLGWGQIEKSPIPPTSFVLGEAFWATKVMENEPMLFVQEEGQAKATAKLMFVPTGKLKITSWDATTTYEAGKDYTWKAGTNVVELTEGSRVPFKTTAELYPGRGKPNTENGVLFTKAEDGHFWHKLQMPARYEHDEKWTGAVPVAEPEKLKRSLAKLKAKTPFKVVGLGDSIAVGGNASGIELYWAKKVPPYQPGFVRLATNTLAARFGSPVTLMNLSQGGTRSDWGIQQTDKAIAEKPDLVIVAFGMNDQMKMELWEANIKKIVDNIRAGSPETDFVLVAPMTDNPRFRGEKRFKEYLESLHRLEGEGIAVADMYSVWMDMLKRKNYTDLTGNHLNHCNDFGHVVYAQVVLGLFGK